MMMESDYRIKQNWGHYFLEWMGFLLLVVPICLALTYGGCWIATLVKGGEIKDYLPFGLKLGVGYLLFLQLIAFLRWKTRKWLVFEDRFEFHSGAVFPWNRGVTTIRWEHADATINGVGFWNWLLKTATLFINHQTVDGYSGCVVIPMAKDANAVHQNIESRIASRNFRYGTAEKLHTNGE